MTKQFKEVTLWLQFMSIYVVLSFQTEESWLAKTWMSPGCEYEKKKNNNNNNDNKINK